MSVIENSEEASLASAKKLKQITCIQYPSAFSGSVAQDGSTLDLVLALLYLGSEVNIMHPTFAKRLGLVIQTTNVGAQKIDGTTLETYGMVVAVFSITSQVNRVRFFEETFLVANVSPDMVLGIIFFTQSGANVDFPKREL